MKGDVLTLAAVVFVLAILASSLGISEVFDAEPTPPQALQQGIAVR